MRVLSYSQTRGARKHGAHKTHPHTHTPSHTLRTHYTTRPPHGSRQQPAGRPCSPQRAALPLARSAASERLLRAGGKEPPRCRSAAPTRSSPARRGAPRRARSVSTLRAAAAVGGSMAGAPSATAIQSDQNRSSLAESVAPRRLVRPI